MAFSLALTVELIWLSDKQRAELESLGAGKPPAKAALPDNVIQFSHYYPERAMRTRIMESPTPVNPPGHPRWHWATAAVVAALFLSISPLLFQTPALTSGEYVTGMGEHRTIPLADGSIITMNTQSRLRVRFFAHERVIDLLEGEALFSVAHDPARPFRVHARRTVVEALGTQFSIYLGNSGTKIAVTQGRVKIFESLNQQPIILNPEGLIWTDTAMFEFYQPPTGFALGAGEEAHVPRDEGMQTNFEVEMRHMTPSEIERHLAWVDGEIAFDGETLQEATDEFNRYNWRKLKVSDPAIAEVRIGGWFKTTNVNEFVGALNLLFGVRAVAAEDPISHERVIELKRRQTGPP
jgi:transmembrane sensor